MPIIHIHMLSGRSVDQKRELVAKVTSTVTEVIGVDAKNVHIILHESEMENASNGGVLFLDSRK
jgi:4-oxalocrotonate tautomerase